MELFLVLECHGYNLGDVRPVAAFATEAEAKSEVERLADIAHDSGSAIYNVGDCGYWVAKAELHQTIDRHSSVRPLPSFYPTD